MVHMNGYRRSEAGVVSIMVTMITMIVISLIVLGFADIARTEQRSSLDQQLSTQAYYAAESGVNDARDEIEKLLAQGKPLTNKTGCQNDSTYTLSPIIDATHNVSYPCVLINAAPSSISYNVGYNSVVIPLKASPSAAFGTISLKWKPACDLTQPTCGDLNNCYPNWGILPHLLVANGAGNWRCDYPMLRMDLLDADNPLSRANWNANTTTDFIAPVANGPADNIQTNDRGKIRGAACTGAPTNACTINIIGLGGKNYYMRVTTIYRTDSLLTISANGGKGFTGAQAIIDATGKAQDVLRRILVAVDLTDANSLKVPSNGLALEDSVCKRFGITNSSFNVYQTLGNSGEGNILCQQH